MIGVAAEIVAHREFDVVVQRVQIAEHVRHGRRCDLRIGLGDSVEGGDIGAMVPVMVDFHGSGVDVRLECVGRIAERRNDEGTVRGGGRGRSLSEYDGRRGRDRGGACGRTDKMTAR